MFEMSNETCLNMNEVFLITSHLQIHSWLGSWLSRPPVDLAMFWWNSSLYHLGFCFKMITWFIWTLVNDYGVQILKNGHHLLLNDCLWLLWPVIASSARQRLDDIFLYFWLMIKRKAMLYICKTCLVIKDHSQKYNLPTGNEARCTMILEAMWWYDMMPWGILGTKLGSYRCPYLRSF